MSAPQIGTRWARLCAASIGLALALSLAACGGGGSPADGSTVGTVRQALNAVATPSASVNSVTKISETRVSRTVYDYVFKVTVQNGDVPQTSVIATLTKVGVGTSIIDGSVLAGDLDANASVTPADTITLRHDRALTFNLAALTWQVTGTPVVDPLIDGAQLAGGLSGSALVGQPYIAQVNAFANDKRNSITTFAIANATAGSSTPAIDNTGVLTWTANDADFVSTKTLSVTVTLSQGAPVQFDVPVRVTKERLVHTAELPAAAGTITDPRGRYLIKVEPKVATAPMSGTLTINEIYEASGRFVYAIRVPASAGAKVTVLDSPNLFGSAETPPPVFVQSLARKAASAVRAAATAQTFDLSQNVGTNLAGDGSLAGTGSEIREGANVYTTRLKPADIFGPYLPLVTANSTPIEQTMAWWPVSGNERVFQIDTNCTNTEDLNRTCVLTNDGGIPGGRSPVILIHGFEPFKSVGGGKGTWGALAETLTARGHPVYELRWNTYMRFEEAAGVLAKLGIKVASITGKKVHVIAHSFGGIVAHQALMGKGIVYSNNKWEVVDPQNAYQRLITLGAPLSGISLEPSTQLSLTSGRDASDLAITACKSVTCLQAGADTWFIATLTGNLAANVSLIDPARIGLSDNRPGESIRNLQKAWQDGTAHNVSFTTVSDIKQLPKQYKYTYYNQVALRDQVVVGLTNATSYRLGDGLISLMGHAVVASDFSSTPYAPKLYSFSAPPADQFNILASSLGSGFLGQLDTKFAGNMYRRVVASQVSTAHRKYYFAMRGAHSCAQMGWFDKVLLSCFWDESIVPGQYLIANYPTVGMVPGFIGQADTVHPLQPFIFGNEFSQYLAEPTVPFIATPPPSSIAHGVVTIGGIPIGNLQVKLTIERTDTGLQVADGIVATKAFTGEFIFDAGAAVGNALPNQTNNLADYRIKLKVTTGVSYADLGDALTLKADVDFGTRDIKPVPNNAFVNVGGTVTNESLQAIAGAQVTLLKGENRSLAELASRAASPSSIARSMTTNAQGQYSAQGLEPGTYSALVAKSGYFDVYQGRVIVGSQGNSALSFMLVSSATNIFREDFNGTSLNTNYWTGVNGISGYSVANGAVQFNRASYAHTNGKVSFEGNKIVLEARFGGLTSNGRDTNIALVDVASGDRIQVGDTSYQGQGYYVYATGAYGLGQQSTGSPSTSAYLEYRITLEDRTLTLERGSALNNLTVKKVFTLPQSSIGRRYYLQIGTGGGVEYSPGTFDWVQVTGLR